MMEIKATIRLSMLAGVVWVDVSRVCIDLRNEAVLELLGGIYQKDVLYNLAKYRLAWFWVWIEKQSVSVSGVGDPFSKQRQRFFVWVGLYP